MDRNTIIGFYPNINVGIRSNNGLSIVKTRNGSIVFADICSSDMNTGISANSLIRNRIKNVGLRSDDTAFASGGCVRIHNIRDIPNCNAIDIISTITSHGGKFVCMTFAVANSQGRPFSVS